MRILQDKSVKFLRHTPSDDSRFPNPWEASNEQLESVDYIAEIWPMSGPLLHVDDDMRIVVTFSELKQSYDEWDQSDMDEPYDSVHDWIRDCIDHGIHPCSII